MAILKDTIILGDANIIGNTSTSSINTSSINTSSITTNTINNYPIFFSYGSYGRTWPYIPTVKSDGVMEIGKYIDFHSSSEASLEDYAVRLMADSNALTVYGSISSNSLLPLSNNTYDIGATGTRWKNGYFSNSVYAASGFFQSSDMNKKNVISDISLDKAYDLIDKCQTIIYTLKDDPDNKEQIGMIAQEVKEFFPEIISEDKDGMLSLDYARLTVVILKVLKDLVDRVKKLEG